MGWLEILIAVVLILTFMAAVLSWQRRWFAYAALSGLLFIITVMAVIPGSPGDRILKKMQEDKATADRLKWTG